MEKQLRVFAFILIFAGSASTFALPNTFQPVKITCATFDQESKPFVFVDFDIKKSEGNGTPQDPFAKEYTTREYPFKSHRLITLPGNRFRISAEVREHAQMSKQHYLLFSVYEEIGDTLIQRIITGTALDGLQSGARSHYDLPNSRRKLICHMSLHASASRSKPLKKKFVSP